MKNFVQTGDCLTVTAPAAIASGDGVLIGNLFGIAAVDAANGGELELAVTGVYDLPKVAGTAIAVGDPIYWDDGNSEATPVDNAGANPRVGIAIAAAADASTICRVRLDGAAT